jgi:predicted membrane-bound spermidine synthase
MKSCGALTVIRIFAAQRSLVGLFFFISGVPALVYQLAWQRVLFRLFGVNMESVTIVVTAFMLGLGIGSLIGSWLADRRNMPPLLLIAVIETAIGLFGIFSLKFFSAMDPLVSDLSLLGQVAAALVLLFLPTALMGMTLPLLVGHFIARSANVGLSTGSLYYANTMGAVVGCLAATFALFPWLGLQHSVWSAAAINLAIGACALAAFLAWEKKAARPVFEPQPVEEPARTTLLSFRIGLGLAFFVGFISLSYEIILVRLANYDSGSTTTAMTLTLAVFLLGIASGARTASEWCAGPMSSKQLCSKIVTGLMVSTLAGLLLLPVLRISFPLGQAIIAIILIATFAIARALGAIFPLLAHFAVQPDSRSGGRVGLILLADILGSAAGALLTGFVLTDVLGAQGLAVTLALLTLGVAAPFARLAWGAMKRSAFLLGLASAAVLVLFQEPLSARVMDAMLYKAELREKPPLSGLVENRDGIIAQGTDGTVYGNGVYDGHFNVSLVNDVNGIIRPFGLSLYHPHPRDVLMIGLASGSWAQVIASNPEVEHFTVVEINPGYLPLIRARPEVASLLKNPKVRIVFDDGRRWLRRNPQVRFDAVIANTTYHFRANASSVLSLEFDNLIRAHLKPGGIFFYNTTSSLRALRTGCVGFRYGYRVTNHLLVSDAPFDLDVNRWRTNLLATKIDGKPVFDPGRPGDMAALRNVLALTTGANGAIAHPDQQPMEPCSVILARTAALQPITDDNMGTEWRYALGFE